MALTKIVNDLLDITSGNTTTGNIIVTGNTTTGNLIVTGNTRTGNLIVTGNVTGNLTVTGVLKLTSTDAAIINSGTTAQRPVPAATGMFRFNTTGSQFEGYNGSAWTSVGGASGGAANPFVYENDITISVDYTITTNKNAMSAGPLTLNSGITVTVPSGSTWVVL